MKIFNTVDEYLQEAKPNDKIILSGKGIMDGLKNINSKYDVLKVHSNTTKEKIVVRYYKGRSNLTLGANSYDQKVALLTETEYKKLN
jgi:hypothetical protein